MDRPHEFVKMETEKSASHLWAIDRWFVSLSCPVVYSPSCVPQWTACVWAAAWSWSRSWFRSWSWSILLQDTVWIRNTVWSSTAPRPPCLDTRSSCITMELTTGLDLLCSSDIDLWLILYLLLAIDLLLRLYWVQIYPLLIFSIKTFIICFWSSTCYWLSIEVILIISSSAIDALLGFFYTCLFSIDQLLIFYW